MHNAPKVVYSMKTIIRTKLFFLMLSLWTSDLGALFKLSLLPIRTTPQGNFQLRTHINVTCVLLTSSIGTRNNVFYCKVYFRK
jgi:hypothetical protein